VAEWLSPPERLAIAYASRPVRALWTGLILLDKRLAHSARESREPIMVQLRLAWWRDQLAKPPAEQPRGEPLLALLAPWHRESAALIALVDGQEAQAVGEDGGAALDRAREAAIVALARLSGVPVTPALAAAALAYAQGEPVAPRGLPRAMRPLLLLDHFDRAGDRPRWRVLAGALRKGLLGF